MSEVRLRKVESLLKRELTGIIMSDAVKDPRVDKMLTLTDISLSKDMKYAKVYISFYGKRETHVTIVEALSHASGYLRGLLAKKVNLRTVPELKFILDESIERGFRVIEKIKEVLD